MDYYRVSKLHVEIAIYSLYGNTLKVGQEIGRALSRIEGVCVSIQRIWGGRDINVGDADVLVVGSPVHYMDCPRNVKEWLTRLEDGRGRPAAVFVTHGGVPGLALKSMGALLVKQGWRPVAGRGFVGYDYWAPYEPYGLQAGRPNEKDLMAAREFAVAIFQKVMLYTPENWTLPREFRTPPLMGWIYRAMQIIQHTWLPRKRYNPNKCIHCSLCARACPTGAIKKDPSEQDVERCVNCYECVRACQTGALTADWKKYRIFANAYVPFLKAFWQKRH